MPEENFTEIPDECVATGQSCTYTPSGPHGMYQCEYCGKEETKVENLFGLSKSEFSSLVMNTLTNLVRTKPLDFTRDVNECVSHSDDYEKFAAALAEQLYVNRVKPVIATTTALIETLRQPPAPPEPLPLGDYIPRSLREVQDERVRQVRANGYDPEHDVDTYADGELGREGAAYIMLGVQGLQDGRSDMTGAGPHPLHDQSIHWRPQRTPRQNIVKGTALVIAELDRELYLEQQRGN